MKLSRHAKTWPNAQRASTRASRRGGFTLIEIMVVLVIAALLVAIVISGFTSVSANNRRTTCQTNMTQIYAALRLYAADADGKFPYYGGKDASMPDPTTAPDESGIGLWALYTFPSNSSFDQLGPAKDDSNARNVKPIAVYLRKVGALHCPADTDDAHSSLFGTVTGNVTPYNMDYLSYQVEDADSGNQQTYKTTRVTGIPTDPKDKRQLLTYGGTGPAPKSVTRTPPSDTVITWCKWHRDQGTKRDIVLFYDGSVQSIDKTQDDPNGGAALEGWNRVPKPTE